MVLQWFWQGFAAALICFCAVCLIWFVVFTLWFVEVLSWCCHGFVMISCVLQWFCYGFATVLVVCIGVSCGLVLMYGSLLLFFQHVLVFGSTLFVSIGTEAANVL